MPRICFTDHAIDRFLERHAPRMNRTRARYVLERGSETATRLRAKTYKGQTQWQLEYPDVVLVTKNDNREIVCVTILPEPEGEGGTPQQEMEMAYERLNLVSLDTASQNPAVLENEVKLQELATRKIEARLKFAADQDGLAQLRGHFRRVEKTMNEDASRCLRIAMGYLVTQSSNLEVQEVLNRIRSVNPYFEDYIDPFVEDSEVTAVVSSEQSFAETG